MPRAKKVTNKVKGLKKLVSIRWYNADGSKAAPNTPGAKKVRQESADWYWVRWEGGTLVRDRLGPDKAVAENLMNEMRGEQVRGNYGLHDYGRHRKGDVNEAVDAYLKVLVNTTRSEDHQREVGRVLRLVVAKTGATKLADLSADAIQAYLVGLDCAAATKNKHRVYLSGFFNYLVGAGKLPANPITKHSVKRAVAKDESEKRERRALTPDELKKLFVATHEYTVSCHLVHRGGRPRKDGTPAQPRKPVQLTPETMARLDHQGRGRRLMYLLATFTGLRRGELSRLRVRHLDWAALTINLPGVVTKNKRPACIPLVPLLAQELRNWTDGKSPNDPVVNVPDKSNLVRIHKCILKVAGIEYEDAAGRHADFHALRMTVNTYLAREKVSDRERDLFLRHAAGDLKGKSYDGRHEMDDAVAALARLWAYCTR